MTYRQILIAGAISGFLGVALGAFGAHALKPMLAQSGRLETFELAVRYQFYHALALLLVGFWQRTHTASTLSWAGLLLTTGMIFFSGSLYGLCLTGITSLAFLTPFGGVLLLAGWAMVIAAAWKTGKV